MTAINNLYARTFYPNQMGTDLPVVLLMPGFLQSAASFEAICLKRIANYGLVVVAVGMRGRDGADGSQDAAGREIYDVIDALTYVRATAPYSSYASQNYAAVVGYSGGGGVALATACKFPDLFCMIVSHFGVGDYGYDGTYGWYQNGASAAYKTAMETRIGGTPTAVPDAYRARNAVEAITNYSSGHLYLFHDTADTSVPVCQSQRIGAAMLAAGMSNYTENYTTPTDSPRWLHSLPDIGTPVIQTEPIWAPPLAAKTYSVWTVPASGTHRVIGYIKTKRYTCWLGTGISEVANVTYGVTSNLYTVEPLTGSMDVTIIQADGKTVTQTIATTTDLVVA